MKPILCGGYDHPHIQEIEEFEITDCPPPEPIQIYGHDPRSGLATIFTEIVCPTCSPRRRQAKLRRAQ